MAAPQLTYKSIKVNNVEITEGEVRRVSFKAPFNHIEITFNSDIQLKVYEVRVTKDGEPYDIDLGTVPVYETNVTRLVDRTVSFDVSSTYFNKGTGLYRISLYAQSAVAPYEWDVTYLFMVASGSDFITFVPAGSDGMEVATNKEIE